MPPYRKEEGRTQVKTETTDSNGPTDVPRPPSEQCEVNLDYIQAFEEQYTSLPARPDILLLPSDLKPFVKVFLTVGVAGTRGVGGNVIVSISRAVVMVHCRRSGG